MDKASFPPLLDSGFHTMKCDEIKDLCVNSFPESQRRGMLYDSFNKLLVGFNRINSIIHCISEIWIDGSFTTEKLDPDDIDILVVLDPSLLNQFPEKYHGEISQLLDRNFVKLNYNIDVLLLYKNTPNYDAERSYWRGWFGFDRKEDPKGLIRIDL